MSRRLCACVLTAGTFVRQPWKKLWSLVLYVLVKRQLTFYIILLLLDVCKKDVTAAELWQLCSQFYLRFGWHTLIGVYFSVFLVLSSNKAYPMNGFRYVVCLKAFEWRLKFCVTCIILFVCMFLFWSCLQTQQCNRVSDLAYCTCKKKKSGWQHTAFLTVWKMCTRQWCQIDGVAPQYLYPVAEKKLFCDGSTLSPMKNVLVPYLAVCSA